VMSFEEALAMASRDEGFKATVYAMNTLLIHKVFIRKRISGAVRRVGGERAEAESACGSAAETSNVFSA